LASVDAASERRRIAKLSARASDTRSSRSERWRRRAEDRGEPRALQHQPTAAPAVRSPSVDAHWTVRRAGRAHVDRSFPRRDRLRATSRRSRPAPGRRAGSRPGSRHRACPPRGSPSASRAARRRSDHQQARRGLVAADGSDRRGIRAHATRPATATRFARSRGTRLHAGPARREQRPGEPLAGHDRDRELHEPRCPPHEPTEEKRAANRSVPPTHDRAERAPSHRASRQAPAPGSRMPPPALSGPVAGKRRLSHNSPA